MASSSPATNEFTIDVTKDLESTSALKSMFTGQRSAVFGIGSELVKFLGKPIQAATGGAPVEIDLTGDPEWKTSTGISLSLTQDATCTIAVSNSSKKFPVCQDIDSTATTDVVCGPTSNIVYVNIDLDFDIKGGLSGSGTVSGIGISGKASGAATTTFSYCHPVDATTETAVAIRQAFAALVVPFEPDCAIKMPVGSLSKVNFDGSLNFELDVTYGLGSYKCSAQSLGLVQQGMKVAGHKLQPPEATLDAGAKASVCYTHDDNFSMLVQKNDQATALLYLLRSASDETRETLGVTVGVSCKSVSATVDGKQLASVVAKVTGSTSATLQNGVAACSSDLESTLISKANSWLSSDKGNAGLLLSLSQQKARTVLFEFRVDLSSANAKNLAQASWKALVAGDMQQAMQIKGFTLLPGSGAAQDLKRTSSIQLHFFDFQLSQTTDYFKNVSVSVGPQGSLRFFADIGEQSQFCVKSSTETATIHFVATASAATTDPSGIQNAEVDLQIELSETNKPSEASRIASSIASIAAIPAVQNAQSKMLDFVNKNGSKTLTLISIFRPTAYQKLSCSPYISDGKGKLMPPPLPEAQDRQNWGVFQNSVARLMPDLGFVLSMDYTQWTRLNVKANDGTSAEPDAQHIPDRRDFGDYVSAAQNLFNPATVSDWQARMEFLLGSESFMNLCDNLQSLAKIAAAAGTPSEWKALLKTLDEWVNSGVNPDWSKPALSSLLALCNGGSSPAQVDATFLAGKGDSKFTCTLTIS